MENTPESVILSLKQITTELDRIALALYDAECKMIDCEHAWDLDFSKALLTAGGSIPDRQANARIITADKKLALDLAKAEYNRLKLKMKTLSDQATITAVIAKQIELQWKHS